MNLDTDAAQRIACNQLAALADEMTLQEAIGFYEAMWSNLHGLQDGLIEFLGDGVSPDTTVGMLGAKEPAQ